MTRPRSKCKIGFCPPFRQFYPLGCGPAGSVEFVEISAEEAEALRLKNIKNFDQTQAAEKMGISQSTFQRILSSAYKKVTEALIMGKEIRIIESKQ